MSVLGCEAKRIVCEKEKKKAEKRPVAIKIQVGYANALLDYSLFLTFVGNTNEACIKSKKSVDKWGALAKHDPTKYEPSYSAALSRYANCLAEIAQLENAIMIDKKALDILERLAQQNSDDYESNYDIALNNYATRLSNIGQNEEAFKLSKRSLDICKRLALNNPNSCEFQYSASLNNHALILNHIGHTEEALKFIIKSLNILECLAQNNPDRYETDYANSLNNCASFLINTGQYALAIDNQSQSMEIRERLHQQLPQKFAFGLAWQTFNHQLLHWLDGEKWQWQGTVIDGDVLENIEAHKQPVIKLRQLFLTGINASLTDDKNAAFEKIWQIYSTLSIVNQQMVEENYHCAAAWLCHNGIQGEHIAQWPEQWQQFKTRRKGNVPVWMLDLVERLEVEFPD